MLLNGGWYRVQRSGELRVRAYFTLLMNVLPIYLSYLAHRVPMEESDVLHRKLLGLLVLTLGPCDRIFANS